MKTWDDPLALPAEEHILVRAAQQGDRGAYSQLVDHYYDRVYRWLYQLTRDREGAEDLTQETFLKALSGLGTFRAGSNFQAWLFRIAHNNFVNQWRATGRKRESLTDDLPSKEAGPAEKALHREALEMVGRAIGRLPADFRAALLLRADEGLSFREIAKVLGISEETARWRVFKARQKLLSVLTPRRHREKP